MLLKKVLNVPSKVIITYSVSNGKHVLDLKTLVNYTLHLMHALCGDVGFVSSISQARIVKKKLPS